MTGPRAIELIPAAKTITDWPSSHVIGGLAFFCFAMLALVFILQHERWRRLWFGQEDPRALGLFRIAFGIVTICQINGMWELFYYLFTDEGLFLTDTARALRAAKQFEGFGNGLGNDPYGFFDFAGFLHWLKGPNYSLLLFWSSPTAFWIHWTAFQIAMILLVLGLWTRPVTWIAWFLFHSLILRNRVYWEGTENVFRCLFFYLAMSRCGHAYSIDNWLRRRRNRQNGVTEPFYRLVPRWPRLLAIFQVAALYTTTGLEKSGLVWRQGDALYYAMNLDHFQRFPLLGVPWEYVMPFFRMASHMARSWEIFFPVVAIGLAIRIALDEPMRPLPKWRVWMIRSVWILFSVALLGLLTSLPPEYRFAGVGAPMDSGLVFVVGVAGIFIGAWLLWRMRHKPFSLRVRGFHFVFDLDWFCRWFLGRRIWLSLGVIFHMHLIVLMNIGWFSPSLLVSYFCFFSGEEVARIQTIARQWWAQSRMRRTVPAATKADLAEGSSRRDPVTAEIPRPHEGTERGLPMSVLLVAWALAMGGIAAAIWDLFTIGWAFAGIAAFLIGAVVLQRTQRPSMTSPLAYGRWGRLFIGSLIAYHLTAVTAWLIPDGNGFKEWRGEVRDPFAYWLEMTQTTQSWSMFSPNPSRSNRFMKVLVTDRDGKTWDLKTDMYTEERRPVPWIWFTRERKINGRIVGESGKWYRKWHARYICRKWALDHDGVAPTTVKIQKVTYPVIHPVKAIREGTPEPMERIRDVSRTFTVYTALCAKEPDGMLPPVIRERHGLPDPGEPVRRWERLHNRQRAWERRKR